MLELEKIFPIKKQNLWLFVIVMLTCFAVSVAVRYQQFETWKLTPSNYFVGERPMMTTLDAPYWLRLAREYNNEIFGRDTLRNFPVENEYNFITSRFKDPVITESTQIPPKFKYEDIPLLSFLISHIAGYFNNNYYLAGTLIIPVLASLFILPLGLYFYKISLPIAGLLGGLIGTFAGGYYMRTSIGRIDTDSLNLFFPTLISLLILLAFLAKKKRTVLIYTALSGISIYFFLWWYGRAGFANVFFAILVFIFFIRQIPLHTILLSSLIFILCANPETFMVGTKGVYSFLQKYYVVKDVISTDVIEKDLNPAIFPNVMSTISEVDHVPMDEIFRRIISEPVFSWVGLLAFFVLAVLRWQLILPLFPLLALGLLSFQSSNRFIMYLAPFIGIGLGWLLQIGIEAIFIFYKTTRRNVSGNVKNERFKGVGSIWVVLYSLIPIPKMGSRKKDTVKKLKNNESNKLKDDREMSETSLVNVCENNSFGLVRQLVLYSSMGTFFWFISPQTAISYVPYPSIHPRVYATFLEVKKVVPKDTVLLTWWDYGYAITDATSLATFHDGGSQNGPKTYFIARSLISPVPKELYKIIQFISIEGALGIHKRNTSADELLRAINNTSKFPEKPIYLFFTADMTGKFGAISKLGSWDIEKGGSKPRAYQNLACNKITNQEMNCRGAKIDLKAGFINNQLALRRLIFIRNGQVMREQNFKHTQGFTLQLIVVGKNIVEVQLIDEEVFSSNYNQMFLLGRYRNDLFEEKYNAFPFSRLYLVRY